MVSPSGSLPAARGARWRESAGMEPIMVSRSGEARGASPLAAATVLELLADKIIYLNADLSAPQLTPTVGVLPQASGHAPINPQSGFADAAQGEIMLIV